jgi:hypothetical protein
MTQGIWPSQFAGRPGGLPILEILRVGFWFHVPCRVVVDCGFILWEVAAICFRPPSLGDK